MKQLKTSPLAPRGFPRLPVIAGVSLGTMATGTKYKSRDDVLLVNLDKGCQVAGVTTKSSMTSAAVDWCRKYLPAGKARALVVNAGNANAFTGRQGDNAAAAIAGETAQALNINPETVFMASTGVIGEDLDPDPIAAAVRNMAAQGLKPSGWKQAAQAMMTTDTFPKGLTRQCKIGNVQVTLNAIAKGSGMIAPDMATMLAFFFTDAAIPARVLRQLLAEIVPDSFNAVTVDGDTSTSDTVLLFATGQTCHKGQPIRSASDPRLKNFRNMLFSAMQDMAQLIVRDGEGAQKFVTVSVSGAANDEAARGIALSIANSPLVKTAIAGADANWGRIVMAVGKSGYAADRDRLRISIGGVAVARRGRAVAGYKEAPVARHMKGREISLAVDVGIGTGKAQVWTTDLTHDYISINADYRS